MSHIAKRSDYFYYIEVWDKQKSRDYKLSNLFGSDHNIEPEYLSGSHRRLDVQKNIYEALFWKTKETAEWRLESMLSIPNNKDSYDFVIKYLTREEFIKAIRNKRKQFLWGSYKKNLRLKDDEIEYLTKLENLEKILLDN